MAGRNDHSIAEALEPLAQVMAQNAQNNQNGGAGGAPDEFRALGKFRGTIHKLSRVVIGKIASVLFFPM